MLFPEEEEELPPLGIEGGVPCEVPLEDEPELFVPLPELPGIDGGVPCWVSVLPVLPLPFGIDGAVFPFVVSEEAVSEELPVPEELFCPFCI